MFGIGCDAELTPAEVVARVAQVAAAGGLCGARGLTGPVADRLEAAMQLVPTEASAQAVRAFRGVSGPVPIRGGAATVELTTLAAMTLYLDVGATMRATGRLAQAVASATTLEQANAALNRLGVRTELDLESDAAAPDDERRASEPRREHEHRAGGVVPGDPADAAAAPRARPAQPHVGVVGLDAPAADLLIALRVRPGQITVEDVAAGHAEL